MADFKLSANFEVRKQAPLDDRLTKLSKTDLIKPESWASDNGTYYVYKNMLVGTSDGLYMLTDVNKLLNSDYSGWLKIYDESQADLAKNDLVSIELSENGEMVLTYGKETNLSNGYINDTGELILEFNYE